MTRPKRPGSKPTAGKQASTGGFRGHAPKKTTAKGRDGSTRDSAKVAREPGAGRSEERPATERRPAEQTSAQGRRYGTATGSAAAGRTSSRGTSKTGEGRAAPPKMTRKKPLPELKRVQLDAPAPDTKFRDRDGEVHTFPDSNLRRVAAQILTEKRKAWRYRPFSFPLFTDKGHEQSFHFDFYIYDAEDSVIKLILVVPSESREVWDRVGRFKRQYPMYSYELWTPEKLHHLSGPRGRLGF